MKQKRKFLKTMHMRYLVNAVVVCTLLLCACDKEDIVDYPITLYAHELSRVSDVRLFVNKNEIYDSDVIRAFVDDSEYFKLPTATELQSSNERIVFLSKDSVLFGTLTTKFTVKKNGQQFLFYSPFPLPNVDYSGDIIRSFLKYTGELIPAYPPFFGDGYLAKEVRVGHGSYRDLEISFLSYILSRHRDTFQHSVCGRLFNEFNEEAKNTLQLRDTLAIQEYKIRFVAK